MTSFSGYIVAVPQQRDFAKEELERKLPEVPGGPTLTHARAHVFNIPRWDEYLLCASVPLADEPRDQSTYRYTIFAVRGFAKIILLAHRRRIVDFALQRVLDRLLFPNLRKVSVFVEPLIKHCGTSDSEYLITSLHGRFAGPSKDLRSMSLYGDDVTRSPLYVEHHGLFNFHSVGLGVRSMAVQPWSQGADHGEIVRLASDGFVNVNLATRQRAVDLIDVIGFVTANRWVEDWVPTGRNMGS